MELRRLEIDGTQIRYHVAGDGAPVVLVHGLSGSWRWWSAVSGRLGERRRIYLVDLPRLGRRVAASKLAAWLGRWLEAVGLERVDVVGHSLGGLIAAELAAEQSPRIRRLALVAAAGIPCGRGLLTRSIGLVETLYGVRKQFPTVAGDAIRTGPFSLLRGIVFVSERDLRRDLASIRVPALLVWGEQDRLTPTWVAEEWQRALPGSRLVLLPCGHVPMWEVPDALADCLLAFFDEELPNDPGDKLGSRVVHRVRRPGNDDEPRVRQ